MAGAGSGVGDVMLVVQGVEDAGATWGELVVHGVDMGATGCTSAGATAGAGLGSVRDEVHGVDETATLAPAYATEATVARTERITLNCILLVVDVVEKDVPEMTVF
jgi:hypothetical protein